ncbi:metallophosphoesterase [Bacillus sp. FJAT-49736]|uniref:metallophosphoesterase n=1 Tax=Bacillus sp. FJAT-49736 TaxID=2833582 RepID=UPI001BC9FBA9|nr:metallophosphoesterase [Bacillus sp. FJAT-49736]MBS4173304.1 metallophosphoesterase family protein [Bacillus sp. FJAT-49736]
MISFFLLLFILGVFLIFFMLIEAFLNQVIHQIISFPDFPAGFKDMRIFFISDIHRRKIHESIIDEVINKADFVIIGGDLLEKSVPLRRVEANLQMLKKLGPIYFVWGNNDYEVEESKLVNLFQKYDVKMLRNESVLFHAENGDVIALMGIDDISKESDSLDLALQNTNLADFKILISHNPSIITKMPEDNQISFIISGHTHGGQIRFLGISPYKKGGIYKQEKSVLLISNGYGTSMLPLRLGAKPETHLITIKRGNAI